MAGRWFEEFKVGQVFEHEIPRTATEADSTTGFGKPLVNSIFTLGLVKPHLTQALRTLGAA